MKKFRVKVKRTHTTWINVEEKSYKTLEDKLIDHDEDLWDKIYEQEMEQMDIDENDWEIYDNNTLTGALSNDTGPRN
tara:strand:+ start:6084 stop:6314 length:231 start_codon:yes stop_codon:yes gene_type:complete